MNWGFTGDDMEGCLMFLAAALKLAEYLMLIIVIMYFAGYCSGM